MLKAKYSDRLAEENCRFAGTGGVSDGNRALGFTPAFQDSLTGQVHVSRYSDGRLAPFHLLDGLPSDWVVKRDKNGRVEVIKDSILSGFVRMGRFYTRLEAADLIYDLYNL